jgi:hypothetical protein
MYSSSCSVYFCILDCIIAFNLPHPPDSFVVLFHVREGIWFSCSEYFALLRHAYTVFHFRVFPQACTLFYVKQQLQTSDVFQRRTFFSQRAHASRSLSVSVWQSRSLFKKVMRPFTVVNILWQLSVWLSRCCRKCQLRGVSRNAGRRKSDELGNIFHTLCASWINIEFPHVCNLHCCFRLSPMCTSRPLCIRYIILDTCQLGLILTAQYISAWSICVVSCCWNEGSRVVFMCSLL